MSEEQGKQGPSDRNPVGSGGSGPASMEDFGPDTSREPDAPSLQGREPVVNTWKTIPEKEASKKPGILERLRAHASDPMTRKARKDAVPDRDWSHVGAGPDEIEAAKADAALLDDAFLKRTFKEVRFPASKEMCLRYVDMEQDFVYGQDRTVNLHNLITHLEEEEFPTRKDLLKAIREQLHHSHAR